MEDNGGDQTLALFDLYWFKSSVLSNLPPPHQTPPLSPPPPELDDVESHTSSTPRACLFLRRTLHRRSLSEEDLSPSATLHILRTPKLQTILSGKESAVSDEIKSLDYSSKRETWRRRRIDRRRRRKRSSDPNSKSLSDLEFEELKGFMDLGFTFSEADADQRLMEIVPGLQRLKAAAAAASDEETAASSCASTDDVAVPRPYLSEAWDVAEEAAVAEDAPLTIVSIEEGADMKNQLRFWAHTVASTVR